MRALCLVALAAGLPLLPLSIPVPPDYEESVLQARNKQAQSIDGPTSWLSLIALQPLDNGDVSVGSAPDNKLRLEHGLAHAFTLHIASGKVTLTAVDPAVTAAGKPLHPGDMVAVSDDDKATLHWSGLWANAIQRTGNQLYLRVGDPDSPNRRRFHGLNFYPINPTYRITAKWVPYTPPHELRMGTVLGTTLIARSPGYAEFVMDGQTVRLDAMGENNSLIFSFRDGTSKTTTYGAGRHLTAGHPSNGETAPGEIVLDFNKATNWPCAYTEFGTCPLPPPQNRFTALIPAGEKRYHD